MSGSEEMVKYLLGRGIEWNVEDLYDITPLIIAEEMRMNRIIEYLKYHEKKKKNDIIFHEGCREGNIEKVKEMIKKGVDIMSRDKVKILLFKF